MRPALVRPAIGSVKTFTTILDEVRKAWLPFRAFSLLRAIVLCGVVSLNTTYATAQDPRTPVPIVGTVLDPSGAAIEGAEVILTTRDDALRTRTATTDSGEFQFDDVKPGKYRLSLRKEGFGEETLKLTVGRRPQDPLLVTMAIEEVHENITVAADEDATDIEGGLDSFTIDKEMLEDLPVDNDDLIGGLAELVQQMTGIPGGVSIVIDGMEDPDARLNPDEIEEIKVSTDTYAAEFSRPGSARINIRTKKGPKDYHGFAGYYFRDHNLNARNAFAIERPVQRQRSISASLSGPIGGDRSTSFYVSGWYSNNNSESVINARTLDGVIRSNEPRESRTVTLSAKLDHRFSDQNQGSFRYGHSDWRDEGSGIGGFQLPEVGLSMNTASHQFRYNHRTVLSPNIVNQFSINANFADRAMASVNQEGRRIIVIDAFTGGSGQMNTVSSTTSLRFNNILSYSKGKHFVKAGLTIPGFVKQSLIDQDNFGGTFEFSSLDDYSLGRPFTFSQNLGDPKLAYWYKEMAGFVQDNVRLLPNLSIGLGVRYEWQSGIRSGNAVAPRFSFAFAPTKKRRTVIRGGAGLFYSDTGAGMIRDVLRLNGERLRQIDITNPGFPDPFSSQGIVEERPSSVSIFDPNIRRPYNVQYGIGVERRMKGSTVVTARYTGIRGVSQFRSRDINAPPPPFYDGRPDPSIGILRQFESSGRTQGDYLRLGLRGRFKKLVTSGFTYTLGKSFGDTNGRGSFPANNYDLSGEWSRASGDARHRFSTFALVRAAKLFNVGIVLRGRTGTPYTLRTGIDANNDNRASDRPLGVARNTEEGPGSWRMDVRWSKKFALGSEKKGAKGTSMRVGITAYNVLNRVNRSTPVGNLSSPFFGQATWADAARQLQLYTSARF